MLGGSDPVADIVSSTYPSLLARKFDGDYIQERAILAPTNDIVHEVKDYVMSMLPGDAIEYLSSDSVCHDDGYIVDREDVYSVEFLKSIKVSGLPNHQIRWLVA